jgi:hypothetical protein
MGAEGEAGEGLLFPVARAVCLGLAGAEPVVELERQNLVVLVGSVSFLAMR